MKTGTFRTNLYRLGLAAIFGWLASFLQHLVLTGDWKSQYFSMGEWIYSTLFLLVLWFGLEYLLKRLPPIIQRSFQPNNLFWGLMISIPAGLVWMFLLGIIISIIVNWSVHINFKANDQLRFILLYYSLLIALNYLIFCSFQIIKAFSQVRDDNERNEKLAMESQLQILRGQLNPHFLFNSLNLIAATIQNNPTVAYDFTKNMANFYRRMMESEKVGWISLKSEIETIQYYLKMLTIRFEDKLKVNIRLTEIEYGEYMIPEFVIHPIIENIIKHNECSRSQPLFIVIQLIEDDILEIKNNVQLKKFREEGLGIGWSNIRDRYQHLKEKSPVNFQEDGWYYAHVPLKRNVSIHN